MAYPPSDPLLPRTDNSPAVPGFHAADHTAERNAINAIVGVLGTNPQATFSDVQRRINDLAARIAELEGQDSGGGGGGGGGIDPPYPDWNPDLADPPDLSLPGIELPPGGDANLIDPNAPDSPFFGEVTPLSLVAHVWEIGDFSAHGISTTTTVLAVYDFQGDLVTMWMDKADPTKKGGFVNPDAGNLFSGVYAPKIFTAGTGLYLLANRLYRWQQGAGWVSDDATSRRRATAPGASGYFAGRHWWVSEETTSGAVVGYRIESIDRATGMREESAPFLFENSDAYVIWEHVVANGAIWFRVYSPNISGDSMRYYRFDLAAGSLSGVPAQITAVDDRGWFGLGLGTDGRSLLAVVPDGLNNGGTLNLSKRDLMRLASDGSKTFDENALTGADYDAPYWPLSLPVPGKPGMVLVILQATGSKVVYVEGTNSGTLTATVTELWSGTEPVANVHWIDNLEGMFIGFQLNSGYVMRKPMPWLVA